MVPRMQPAMQTMHNSLPLKALVPNDWIKWQIRVFSVFGVLVDVVVFDFNFGVAFSFLVLLLPVVMV